MTTRFVRRTRKPPAGFVEVSEARYREFMRMARRGLIHGSIAVAISIWVMWVGTQENSTLTQAGGAILFALNASLTYRYAWAIFNAWRINRHNSKP